MKSQIAQQTPNDLKLTDAPLGQREALGGGTNANAASHEGEKGEFGASPCSATGELRTSMSLSKNWNEAADIVAFLSTLQAFGEFPLSKFEKLLLDFTEINGSPDTAVWAGISLQATVSDSNLKLLRTASACYSSYDGEGPFDRHLTSEYFRGQSGLETPNELIPARQVCEVNLKDVLILLRLLGPSNMIQQISGRAVEPLV